MAEISENRFDRALTLKGMVTTLGTGGSMDDGDYQLLRTEFLNDQQTKKLLPQLIRNSLDSGGVWEHLKDFHTGSGAYAARRKYINDEFSLLLDYLTSAGAPADTDVSEILSRYDGQGVNDAWQRALSRRDTDSEGAITAARTLLEEVCKHIMDDADEKYDYKWDLPKLYSHTAKLMNLAPSQHTEDAFKRILGGCQSIVESLGSLRNKISDAHGGGRRKVLPSKRHASLAVNLAGSMAMYLIETWEIRQSQAERMKAKVETPESEVTHRGIALISRYSLRSEIDSMKRIVEALSLDIARRIEVIWCDSKATSVYSVTVRSELWISDLQSAVGDAVIESCGGHNGIYFDGDAPSDADLDPHWPVDEIQLTT